MSLHSRSTTNLATLPSSCSARQESWLKPLNTQVTAVLIGYQVADLADDPLAEYGADRVIVVDDPELKEYRTEPYAHALASVIKEYKPEIMLVGATAIGRDLGPTVSARVHTGLTADCTKLDIGDFPLQPKPKAGAEAQPAAHDPSGIRRKHHRHHRVPGQPSADGDRTSRRYAEDHSDQGREG
jgi:electron transfer flavoprotein alpha subunit